MASGDCLRYYDPNTGSFLTQDPIKLLGGTNNYLYTPNPVSWVDPMGLKCKEIIGNRGDFNKRFPLSYFNDPESAKYHSQQTQQDTAWSVYQDTSQGSKHIAMGRLNDTEAAESLGYQRLNEKVWSPQINDAWVQGGIDANKPFSVRSTPDISNYRGDAEFIQGTVIILQRYFYAK